MSTYTKLPSVDTVQQRTRTLLETSFTNNTNKVWEAIHVALNDPYCNPLIRKTLEICVGADAIKVQQQVIMEIDRRFEETEDWRLVSLNFESESTQGYADGSYMVYKFLVTFEGMRRSRLLDS